MKQNSLTNITRYNCSDLFRLVNMKVYILNPLYTFLFSVIISAALSSSISIFGSNGKTYLNSKYEIVYGGSKVLKVDGISISGLKSYRLLTANEKLKLQEMKEKWSMQSEEDTKERAKEYERERVLREAEREKERIQREKERQTREAERERERKLREEEREMERRQREKERQLREETRERERRQRDAEREKEQRRREEERKLRDLERQREQKNREEERRREQQIREMEQKQREEDREMELRQREEKREMDQKKRNAESAHREAAIAKRKTNAPIRQKRRTPNNIQNKQRNGRPGKINVTPKKLNSLSLN